MLCVPAAPQAAAKLAELNDPVMVRRRGRMMLPTPQVRKFTEGKTEAQI